MGKMFSGHSARLTFGVRFLIIAKKKEEGNKIFCGARVGCNGLLGLHVVLIMLLLLQEKKSFVRVHETVEFYVLVCVYII